ncbi:MAG: iron-sulfur cluster assembly protein [Bacteroidetes bacterium]|nr:iron-sulfur cluster assembly protein [Bacteroidota bacterium]
METNQNSNLILTKEVVLEALKEVNDPEFPVSIVELGLVYDVKIIDDWVGVKMTLTTPGCGMQNVIISSVRHRVKMIPGVSDADVRLVWQPTWNPSMMSDSAKLKLKIK